MEEFFTTYGPAVAYVGMFLGSCIEGESVVLTISALAYKYDTISLPILMALAFLGSFLADQTLFFVGRRYGPGFIERRPEWEPKMKRVFHHLHRHSTLFILSFRFIYGIRNFSPIAIGAAGIPVKRFMILNCIAAFIWAVLSCGAGYFIGYMFADDIEEVFHKYGNFSKYMLAAIIVVILAGYLYTKYKKRVDVSDDDA
jgi:membrane protein DedA with SNARE-associated domain